MHYNKIISIALMLLFLSSCVYLPRSDNVVESHALPADPDSSIVHLLGQDPLATARALLIETPELALVSRIHMIEAAQSTIDLQYFIWKNDFTGIFLIEELLQAADPLM
jgi:putative cardiolipin synthase